MYTKIRELWAETGATREQSIAFLGLLGVLVLCVATTGVTLGRRARNTQYPLAEPTAAPTVRSQSANDYRTSYRNEIDKHTEAIGAYFNWVAEAPSSPFLLSALSAEAREEARYLFHACIEIGRLYPPPEFTKSHWEVQAACDDYMDSAASFQNATEVEDLERVGNFLDMAAESMRQGSEHMLRAMALRPDD